ncbi:hypothetical protein WJX81_006784 [Elliptochloris bilobata]|uniref:Uncharacterized protein n=1 Tax=Elliptochloris bilobata TaxID=381761 RepID=A0AAW1RDZ5_9CHLO
MFVCLAVLAVIPVSTLVILPPRLSALVLLATAGSSGPIVAAYFSTKGASTAPELLAAAVTLAAGGAAMALAIYLSLWHRLEDNFDAWPWAVEQQRRLAAKAVSALACPFTGRDPKLRCPSCGCLAAEGGFHGGDALRAVGFIVGESVLAWPRAAKALEQVVDVVAARRDLDAALDLRGNFMWCALTACCAGCAAWQRTCALLPRLAAVLAAGAAVAACAPWAFARSLAVLGRFAGIVRMAAAALGIFYALAALAVQLHAAAAAAAGLNQR